MKALLKEKGFQLFEKPYELNIVGVRSPSTTPNSFDDEIHVFYKGDNGDWNYHVFPATTDPGTYWLKNPSSPQGTAILKEGQYINTHILGMHRGKYLALVQRLGDVVVIRDYDRNALLDFGGKNTAKGVFGINIHRAMVSGITKVIDRFSAGCQVFANASDFQTFIGFCMEHRKRHGNKFSYTLIDLRMIAQAARKRFVKIAGITTLAATVIGGGATYWLLRNRKKSKRK